jgi:hypothetical protein
VVSSLPASLPARDFEHELEQTVRTLQRLVRGAAPTSASGDQARRVVDLFARAERAAASGIALFSPVVVETGSYAKAGHGSAADWLGAVSGSSSAVAKSRLAAAGRAAADPALFGALHEADLSAPQLKVVSETAAVAEGASGTLLELAGNGASHQELADAAARLRAAARSRQSEHARRARVNQCRHLRSHQRPEGGIAGAFLCDEVAWARIAPRLEADARRRWKAAGQREPLDAHRLDAFLELLAGGGGSGGTGRPHTLVIVDAEALRRGSVHGGELCEIEGIGPVSLQAASELLGEGGLQFLVRDGIDIRTVTGTTRTLPQRMAAALMVRDRTCCVEGCGKRHGLEADHCRVDFADGGPTSLDNLARLCPEHHDLKTYGGWRLEGGPGHWRWIAPAHPKSAGYIARARKLAAAKAAAIRRE